MGLNHLNSRGEKKTPLKRKLVKFGASRAVILPKEWLEFSEEKLGRQVDYVLLEVNDDIRVKIPAN